MWICNQCHTENQDHYPTCERCGSVRSAGRFGSAPTAMRPQISTPGAAITPARYQQPETRQASSARRAMAIPAKVIGWMLLVLLPLLTALIFWRQYEALSQVLVPLLLDAGADDIWQKLCYAGYGLIAFLLATLPGLRLLIQFPKRARK